MTRETQLSETFVELADTLVNHFDVADLLHTLATRSVDLFDLDAAGLVIADHVGNLRVVGSSIEEARILELLEMQTQEGPCLDCYRSGAPVRGDARAMSVATTYGGCDVPSPPPRSSHS